MDGSGDVTTLLVEWSKGDRAALDQLMPLVYDQLRAVASRHLRSESPGHLLQTTALVHEAYLKLIDQRRVRWENRAQFFGIAARMMRRILVDHARSAHAEKRGSGHELLPLDDAMGAAVSRGVDIVALDEALERLTVMDAAQAGIVELRFFGGLTIEETAEVMKISTGTVKREWHSARLWLFRELDGDRRM